jgi:glycerol-3-phosphate dehydrogenase
MTPDVLIIGGGINGIGIARELAFRGVSVLLVEKGDLCSGTSSQSSKLVHGGIRYLEHGDFSLVADACRERYYLTQIAPHLVSIQPFILPIYKTDKRRPWMIRIGLALYELLALHRRLGHNHMMSVADALLKEPLLRPEGLIGAAEYFDGKMDDARLGIELAMQARSMGAQILTYTPVVACQSLPVPSATLDIDGNLVTITPKVIVNAAGPWADQILAMTGRQGDRILKPTQGIHLVTRPLVSTHALLISAASDNRVLFVIPHGDYSIVGTTDTPYSRDPNSVRAGADNIRYLVSEIERVFNIKIVPSDIYATFAGLRPLVNSTQDNPAAMSRDHHLIRHTDHFFSIIGGKYTTFRSMSEDVARAVMHSLGVPFLKSTRELALPQGPLPTVEYCIDYEFARHVTDYLRRRTDAFFRQGNGLDILESVARKFGDKLGWTEAQVANEIQEYRDDVQRMHTEIERSWG